MRTFVIFLFALVVVGPLAMLGVSAHAAGLTDVEVLNSVPDWLQIVAIVIAAASSVAAITPTPKDDGVLAILRKILDLFALNVGRAKNASADKNTNDTP